jgi:hypothetical protein
MAGLLVFLPTRQQALIAVAKLPINDQIDVMREVYHAHDHMKPWVSNFALESPTPIESVFVQVYHVFRGLAWRLWEERSTARELLGHLHQDTQKQHIERAWEAALLEYTARNLLGLLVARSSDITPVTQLRIAVQNNADPSAKTLLRRLEYLEARGNLDAVSMAEAWRIRE